MNPHVARTPDFRRCCHVKNNGARCSPPALRGEELCYPHYARRERMRSKPRPPQWADHKVPLVLFSFMDDHASIVENLNAAADAFARHDIDYRQLNAITRLCQTCLITLRQMSRLEKTIAAEEMVREVVKTEAGDLQATPNPTPQPEPESASPESTHPATIPAPETPQPKPPQSEPETTPIPAAVSGTLPTLAACADDSFPPPPSPVGPTHPLSFQTPINPENLSHFLPTLTQPVPITPLFPTLNVQKEKFLAAVQPSLDAERAAASKKALHAPQATS